LQLTYKITASARVIVSLSLNSFRSGFKRFNLFKIRVKINKKEALIHKIITILEKNRGYGIKQLKWVYLSFLALV
jgi:hypothetical protein